MATRSAAVADPQPAFEATWRQRRSLWHRWRTTILQDPTVAAGLGFILLWIVVAVTASLWAPYDPLQQDLVNRLKGPASGHWFGTDQLGRDIFSRVLYGARISLPLSLLVVAAAGTAGSLVGAVAGYAGGIIDEAAMRVVDITLSFPAVVLAMAITAALGPGLQNAMLAMIIVWWPEFARLMRGQVLATKTLEHVTAARAVGASPGRILFRHVLPLCVGPVLVKATLDVGNVLLLAAVLSFIGLGAVPPSPEWGAMIAEGRTRFTYWWLATFPGLAIMSAMLGFNFVGDGLRDALDPRGRR